MVSGLDVSGEREKLGIDSYTRLHCARVIVGDGAAAALRPRVGGWCGVKEGSQGVAPLSKCAQWPLRSGQCLASACRRYCRLYLHAIARVPVRV